MPYGENRPHLQNQCFPKDRNFLTPSKMTTFKLFQTQRVCRQKFQIWWKWQKVFKAGGKNCGKSRNCSLRAISTFPTVFSKDLYSRHVKTRACLGKGLRNLVRVHPRNINQSPKNPLIRSSLLGKTWSGQVDYLLCLTVGRVQNGRWTSKISEILWTLLTWNLVKIIVGWLYWGLMPL